MSALVPAFQKFDPDSTGMITIHPKLKVDQFSIHFNEGFGWINKFDRQHIVFLFLFKYLK